MVDTVCAPGDCCSAAAAVLSSTTMEHADFEDELPVLGTVDRSLLALDMEDRLRSKTSRPLMVDMAAARMLRTQQPGEMADLGHPSGQAWSHGSIPSSSLMIDRSGGATLNNLGMEIEGMVFILSSLSLDNYSDEVDSTSVNKETLLLLSSTIRVYLYYMHHNNSM